MSGNNPIASFGFFNPDTWEKLNASKSYSDKNVMMYEDLFSTFKYSNLVIIIISYNKIVFIIY